MTAPNTSLVPVGSNGGNALSLAPAAPVLPVVETASTAVAERERASVEARFKVALLRQRDFDTSRLRLLKACRRPAFAKAARYSKPVGQGRVEGFSIRFAEEALLLWGNLDVSAFLVFDDDSRRIYRVTGTDLETNATAGVDVLVEKYVERSSVKPGQEVMSSRENSRGQQTYRIRATEDDLINKVNSLISKARRNIILSLISADVKEECQTQCIDTQRDSDAKDPEAAKKAVFDSFYALGVMPAQIAEYLGHPAEQITPAELHLLRSIYVGIKEGASTWVEVMEQRGAAKVDAAKPVASTAKGTAGLKQRVAAKPVDQMTDAERDAENERLDEERRRTEGVA